MGLHQVPDFEPGAGACANHRQRYRYCGPAGLLAQVLVGKYADHLPLHRQETIFARARMALPRSTLAQWVGVCGVQLQPLVDALKDEILSHAVLHADETPVVMLQPGNKKTHPGLSVGLCSGRF